MPALNLDVALLHVNKSDEKGNTQIIGPDPFFDDLFARAATKTFVSSEEVVSEELQEEAPEMEVSEEIEMDETKYVGRDEFESKISELKGMIEEMKLGYKEEKLSMEKEIEKLSAEPASEPIAHNPEGEVKQKNFNSFAQNRVMNTRDRVMNRIANLK